MTKEYAMQILREMMPKFARCDTDVKRLTAIPMAIKSLGESKTMTHEEAVGFLQESGWLQDHDRQIYEQGKRVGIEERKTGRWEWYKESPTYMRCSDCGTAEFRKTKYCPHCGAKMERAEELEEETHGDA